MKTHKDLDVWSFSLDLVEAIYDITKNFPSSEQYGLTSQMRRSAISIPSNIAEGAARSSTKEFIQFLYYSLSSLSELETQIIISERLKYFKDVIQNKENIEKLRRMLLNLIRYLKNKEK